MPFKMGTKWLPWIVIAGILVVLMGLFLNVSSTDNREEDLLQRASKVSDRMWLYVTKSQSGSATVPTQYHFYLAGELNGSEHEIVKHLAEGVPFLSGTGTISEIRREADNRVVVAYNGKVFSLSNEASYEDGGQQITVSLSYHLN